MTHRDAPSTSSSVRPFRTSDTSQISAIAKASPEAAQWTSAAFQALDEHGQSAWVLEINGEIRAFLIAKIIGEEAEILNLAVAPAHRRQGCAHLLLQEAFTEFLRSGVQRVFLEVRESNAAGISFYQQHQFVVVGRRPGYYAHPPEAGVLLKKELTGLVPNS